MKNNFKNKFEELKTLKDLGKEFISHTGKRTLERVDVKELKAEAIKWYKFYNKNSKSNNLIENFIATFFNLTENDLKGEEKE